MTNSLNQQRQQAENFQQLHKSDSLLVLPNAWDVASAVIFEKAGFKAIGTTSAGIAYSLGYPDGEYIELEDIIDCSKRLTKRINVPLSVDLETGFSTSLEGIQANVKQIIESGAVGINIEDGITQPSNSLTDIELQVERIQAISELKKDLGIPFVINARTDAFWLKMSEEKDRLTLALERAKAYAEAGADCIFVPAMLNRDLVQTLVTEIPLPLNIIATPDGLSIAELEELSVARLSLGSGPARASLGLTQKIANELKQGSFESMIENALGYDSANKLFSK